MDKILRTEQNTCRLTWLDVLKGMGIIFVLVGHIYANQRVFNWLYSFHMPLFFFAAGWVYRQKPIVENLKRRIQTIAIPYFSFGTLMLIYWQIIERRFRGSDMSFISAIWGLILGQFDYLDFNVHLWFLPCFFMTVIFYNAMVSIGGKKSAWIASALMSVVYVLVSIPGLPWGIDRVFKYIGFYAVGHALAENGIEEKVEEQNDKRLGILGIGLIVLNFGLSYFGLYTGVMWYVTALVGVSGVLVLSVLINENKVLEYFGRISLVVLCVHGPVYRILTKLVSIPLHLSTDDVRSNFYMAMIIVVMTLVICAAVYETVIRIAPWAVGKKKS